MPGSFNYISSNSFIIQCKITR